VRTPGGATRGPGDPAAAPARASSPAAGAAPTRPSSPAAGAAATRAAGPIAWNRAAGLALLAAGGIYGWWPMFGSAALWAVPIAVAACLVSAHAIPARVGAALLVAWMPAALLLAGLPPRVLRPRALGETSTALQDGLGTIAGAHGARLLDEPWALAAALVALGLTWSVAALLATAGPAPRITALVIAAHPILAAVLLESTPPNAAWHGVVVLAAMLLWATRGRLAIALPAVALVSLVAVTAAQAFGPHDRWLHFDGSPRKPAFSRLDPTQSYGPLTSRRTGATMLEVTSEEPALWRMQALEDWDGRGWAFVRNRAPLPEPRAVEVTTKVRIVGLANRLIAAPGRITAVDGLSPSEESRGESWRLLDSPAKGETYTVTSEVVQATADELAKVRIPTSDVYDQYTRFWPRRSRPGERPVTRLADHLNGWLRQSPWGDAIVLARRLSQGTDSELEVVRRVADYLTSGHFRYTTDVAEPGADPLMDFLFKTRAGYCQHFAGAAALLLRLAGVPTRVVSGFATGKRTGEDTYDVRDEDAHAWIEVYFPGFGWVPFNPTPPSAEADVAPETDVLASRSAAGGIGSGTPTAALAGLAFLGLAGALWRLRRRRPAIALGELLARLAPDTVGPSTTLTALRPRLAAIGPATAALAEQAERARFAADGTAEPPRPRLLVWRALASDVGALRATRSLLRTAR
jgi:hypothetical protein